MTRTVREAALLLNAMTGNDGAEPVKKPQSVRGLDYTQLLQPNALAGRRIGYPIKFDTSIEAKQVDPQFSLALEIMQAAGATLIPVEFIDPESEQVEEAFSMGIKRNLPVYLATRKGLAAQSLEDLVQFNENAPGAEGYGQTTLSAANDIDFDERTYNQLWQKIQSENAAAIDNVLVTHRLDALVLDVGSPGLNVAPLAGYPGIMMPSGIDDAGVPTSVYFFGARWSEAKLLALAYGYEQVSRARRAPAFNP
jgi:amidase